MKVLLFLILGCLSCSAQVHLFLDDTDGRTVGAVEALPTRAANGVPLTLKFSARNPWIDPERGWQHRRGMNRNTGFQLEALAQREGRLAAVVRDRNGRVVDEGRLLDVLRGEVRGRARRPDGSFAYDRVLDPAAVTGLELRGAVLAPGRYQTEIWAYGERRMSLDLQVDKRRARVLRAVSRGHGDADPARGSFPDDQVFVANESVPPPGPVADEAWAELDLEAKWRTFRESDLDPTQWMPFLGRIGDEAFMEQLALYEPGGFEVMQLGVTLKKRHSDRWIRLAAWHQDNASGHMMSATQAMLTNTNSGPDVLAWLERHPDQTNQVQLAKVMIELRDVGIQPAAQLDARPPHNPAQIYRHWADPEVESTDEQFDRGIHAFVIRGKCLPPYLERLHQLAATETTLHRRQSALLAYASLPSEHVPFERIVAMAEDEAEDDRIREAAVLGTKAAPRAPAFVFWHEIAAQPAHPGWSAAVSYLRDRGTAYTVSRLTQLGDLADEQIRLVADSVDTIRKREAARKDLADKKSVPPSLSEIQSVLEAERRQSSVHPSLRAWVLSRERGTRGTPHFEGLMKALKKNADKPGPEAERVRRFIRELMASDG